MKSYRLTVLMYQDHTLGYGKRNSRGGMFRIVPKFKKEKAAKRTSPQSGRAELSGSRSSTSRPSQGHPPPIRALIRLLHWAEHTGSSVCGGMGRERVPSVLPLIVGCVSCSGFHPPPTCAHASALPLAPSLPHLGAWPCTCEALSLFLLCSVCVSVCVVERWGTEEVGVWLEQLSLGEYRETFTRHDIRGSELLHLERRDLKVNTHLLAHGGPVWTPTHAPLTCRNPVVLRCIALLGFFCLLVAW